MRTIVHISDLHFGRVDEPLLKPLAAMIHSFEPHAVVVSGDLTQRARSVEFQQARAFLDTLPSPQIVVPGNHDVPAYNLAARLFRPLTKYKRYISEDLAPFFTDDEIAILGINTARSLTLKGGRIALRQIEDLRARMCAIPEAVVKVVVTHHPFDLPENSHHDDIVGRAHLAMQAIVKCGVDVILSGHLHQSHIGHAATRFKINGQAALIVQAGTATSTRGRGEPNTFNLIRIEGPQVAVEQFGWDRALAAFTKRSCERFERSPEGWTRTAC